MDLATRLRGLVPFLSAGLVVPLLFAAVVVALPDDRIATASQNLVIVGDPTDRVRSLSEGPVVNVTVQEIVRPGPNATVQQGQVVQVLVPAHALGAEAVQPGSDPVPMALSPTTKGAANGTWQGFLLEDARPGLLWGLQRQALSTAAWAAIPSVAGAALVAYALGLPRYLRPPQPGVDVPPAAAGLALGVYLGGLVAALGTAGGPFFAGHADGLPTPGVLGWALAAIALVGAAYPTPLVAPAGRRTATVAGVAALIAVPAALVGLWEGALTRALAEAAGLQFIAVVAGMAVLGVAAARLLSMRWARVLAIFVFAAPGLWLLKTGWAAVGLAAPLLVVAASLARDLWEPRL